MAANGEAPYQGRIGLTSRSSVHVTSDAGGTFSATTYTSINVTQNPELKKELHEGNLNQVTCPHTQAVYQLAVPIVYHDETARVFGLILPDALRHQEFEHRRRILESLQADAEPVPAYVRNFGTYFSLESLIAGATSPSAATTERPKLDAPQDLESSKEMARQRAALEEERKQIEVERTQLDDVRERFDKEREQLDEAQTRLAADRTELDTLRTELEAERQRIAAEKLNIEQSQLRAESEGTDVPVEGTQVVTDDQFIVELDEDDDVAIVDDADLLGSDPEDQQVNALTSGVPGKFNDLAPGLSDRTIKIVDGAVVAAAKLPREDAEGLMASNPEIMIQLHDIDDFPVIGLTLARFEDGNPQENTGWALDFSDTSHRLILDELAKDFSLRVGLYGPNGALLRAIEVAAPLRDNLSWIRETAEAKFKAAKPKIKFAAVAKKFAAKDFERIGSMKHNFEKDSFLTIGNTSEAKLAAGIVGFWSTPEKFEYLVANRSFPAVHFRAIQERVVRAATANGIYMAEPLRDIAVELKLAKDEEALAELLIANFAEVCISIRANDLDSGDQWDNWDALLGLGDDLGLSPDPDVVELAEVSLKRAQEQAEFDEMGGNVSEVSEASEAADEPVVEVDRTLIVSKQSDSTGVTYFLPQDAVLDSFDDLAEMPRADLELLLKDAKGRLEASQMLLERFGSATVAKVMTTAEEMSAPEVAALARFVETKANGLEGDLVRTVESGGPSATFVAAHALTAMRSSTAIPALIDALQDPKRNGNSDRLVRTLSHYGDKLVPALSRVLKKETDDADVLIELLAQIENYSEGTLNKLSKDRSKKLREAARKARELRE